jgi:hypothetical protein
MLLTVPAIAMTCCRRHRYSTGLINTIITTICSSA